MLTQKSRKLMRKNRQARIRAHIRGTQDRPRLAVYRSNQSLFVQIINDAIGKTVLSQRSEGKNVASAREVGLSIAKAAKAKGITSMVFDRGGNRYHGIVKALADAVREGGIKV